MRKNGSRLISLRQYRLTDLFLLAVILTVFELILHFALKSFAGGFTYSPLIPITVLVMFRWGWPSVIYAVGDGILYCALNGLGWQSYIVYGAGNALIAVLLLLTKFAGKNKISSAWYFTALFVTLGWAVVFFGRVLLSMCFGTGFTQAAMAQIWELMSLVIGILLVCMFRRFDGMLEDQKQYLKRTDAERKELRRHDEFGDEPVEIDEETFSILKKWDDGLDK